MQLRTYMFLNRIRENFSNFFSAFGKNISKRRWVAPAIIVVVAVAVSFFIGHGAYAQFESLKGELQDLVMRAVVYILYHVGAALAWIVLKMFSVIIMVAAYNDFVTMPAVTKGWVLIRDICNMLVVIVLLVFAFATILRIQKYSDRKMLPRLLIAALLINFSKLICGIVIDAAQVFMMTFVNGFAATAGANLIVGLGLQNVFNFGKAGMTDPTNWGQMTMYLIMADIFLLAMAIVVFMIMVTVCFRVAMLWILVVVSPFGFLGISHFPRLSDYANKWWDEFFNWVIIGPILAFFLWLSLLVMADSQSIDANNDFAKAQQAADLRSPQKDMALATFDKLPLYLLSLTMLYGAYAMAKKVSATVGPLARYAGAGFVLGQAMGYAKKTARMGLSTAKFTGKVAGKGAMLIPGVERGVAGVQGYLGARKKAKEERVGEWKEAGSGLYARQRAVQDKAVGFVKGKALHYAESGVLGTGIAAWKAARKESYRGELASGGVGKGRWGMFKEHLANKNNQYRAEGQIVAKKSAAKGEALNAERQAKDIAKSREFLQNAELDDDQKQHILREGSVADKTALIEKASRAGELEELMTGNEDIVRKVELDLKLKNKKEFRDAMMESFPHAFFDTKIKKQADGSESDSDKQFRLAQETELKKAFDKYGTSKLSAASLGDEGTMRVLKEYTGKNFAREMGEIYKKSNAEKQGKIEQALLKNFNNDKALDDEGNLDKFRQTYMSLTGKVDVALETGTGRTGSDGKKIMEVSAQTLGGVQGAVRGMSTDALTKLKISEMTKNVASAVVTAIKPNQIREMMNKEQLKADQMIAHISRMSADASASAAERKQLQELITGLMSDKAVAGNYRTELSAAQKSLKGFTAPTVT